MFKSSPSSRSFKLYRRILPAHHKSQQKYQRAPVNAIFAKKANFILTWIWKYEKLKNWKSACQSAMFYCTYPTFKCVVLLLVFAFFAFFCNTYFLTATFIAPWQYNSVYGSEEWIASSFIDRPHTIINQLTNTRQTHTHTHIRTHCDYWTLRLLNICHRFFARATRSGGMRALFSCLLLPPMCFCCYCIFFFCFVLIFVHFCRHCYCLVTHICHFKHSPAADHITPLEVAMAMAMAATATATATSSIRRWQWQWQCCKSL